MTVDTLNPDEYAALKTEFAQISERAKDALNEASPGREIQVVRFYSGSRYGVIVQTNADGINEARFSGSQKGRKGKENTERFFLGIAAEAITKGRAQKSDNLTKTKRVINDFHATMNAAPLVNTAIAEAQKAGEKVQRQIDEESYEWFPAVAATTHDKSPVARSVVKSSAIMGVVDVNNVIPLLSHMFSTIKESVDRKLGAKLEKVDILGFHYADAEIVADSDGTMVDMVVPRFGIVVIIQTKDGNKAFKAIRGVGGPELLLDYNGIKKDSYDQVATELAEACAQDAIDLDRAQGTAILGTDCFAILGCEVTGVLCHELLGHPSEGDEICANRRDKSAQVVLKSRLGSQISDNRELFVGDTGLLDIDLNGKVFHHNWGAVPFDNEGSPGKDTMLIERGVQTNFLSDSMSMNEVLDGLPEDVQKRIVAHGLSGNVRREKFDNDPQVRMRCTYMKANSKGAKSIDELAAFGPKNKKGIYIKSCEGGWVEPRTGTFCINGAVSYLVENGLVNYDKPIKGVKITGNIQKFGNTIQHIGSAQTITGRFSGMCGKGGQWVPVEACGPAIYLDEVKLGGGSPYSFIDRVVTRYIEQTGEARRGLIANYYFPEVNELSGLSIADQQKMCFFTHAFSDNRLEMDLIVGRNADLSDYHNSVPMKEVF